MQTYPTPFKTHLSFFLPSSTASLIHFTDSLRGWLSLGLNLPVSLVAATGMQIMYGNTGSILLGPLRSIDIMKVRNERYMLEDLPISEHKGCDLSRQELMEAVKARRLMDQVHVWGLWAIAARGNGRVDAGDLRRVQQGRVLWELRERRRVGRKDVLPFLRGGPGSVGGHSWAVERLFGVEVYKEKSEKKS